MAKLFQILDTSNGNQKLKSLTGADVGINTTNFNHNLSSSDVNLQTALETIDDLVVDKVKASATDTTSGYLINKLSSSGIIGISEVNNKVNLDVELPVITEAIRDNIWYNTNTIIYRDFPENSNLEIGKKYIMNFYFNIVPDGTWNGDMGLCYLFYTENNNNIILSGWPLNQLLWSTFYNCLGENPCMQFSTTSWGAYFQGSKVITAQDINGVGKIRLYFDIHIGHPQWRIYHDTKYSFIEFIKIDE